MAKIEVGTEVRNTRHQFTGVVADSYEVDGTTHYIVDITGRADGQRFRKGEQSSWSEEHVEVIEAPKAPENLEVEMGAKSSEVTFKPQQKPKKTKDDDRSSFFSVGDRVKKKGTEGYATHTVVRIEKGTVTTKPDFRLGESTTCSGHYDLWETAENDPDTTEQVEMVTPELIPDKPVEEPTEEPQDVEKLLTEREVADAVAKARWKTLKVTAADIASDIGVTEEYVNTVVASEDYLTVIQDYFREYKSWQTYAKKLQTSKLTIAKMADRLWISEEEVSNIVVNIVGITI